jgi:uncharacterized membrane protein YfcA
MSLDPLILLVASLTLFVGAMAKGAIGFGLPMIAIPALTAVGSLPLALSIVVPCVVATNLWQIWRFWDHRHVPFMPKFMMLGIIGLVCGTLALRGIENAYLEILLGCLVLYYLVASRKAGPAALSEDRVKKLAVPVGGIAGAVHGMTGLSGLVGTPFFHAAGLARPEFIFSTSVMFIVFSSLHVPTLAAVGLYQSDAILTGVLAVIPGFLGLWLGGLAGDRLNATTFRRLVQIMLACAAILPIWNGLSHLLAVP